MHIVLRYFYIINIPEFMECPQLVYSKFRLFKFPPLSVPVYFHYKNESYSDNEMSNDRAWLCILNLAEI